MIYENMIIYWKMFDNQEFHRQCSMSLIEMWWLRDHVVKRSYDCLIADIQGKSIFHETSRNIWNFFTPTIFTIWCPAMQFRFRCLKIYLFSNWAYSGLCSSQCVGVLSVVSSAPPWQPFWLVLVFFLETRWLHDCLCCGQGEILDESLIGSAGFIEIQELSASSDEVLNFTQLHFSLSLFFFHTQSWCHHPAPQQCKHGQGENVVWGGKNSGEQGERNCSGCVQQGLQWSTEMVGWVIRKASLSWYGGENSLRRKVSPQFRDQGGVWPAQV